LAGLMGYIANYLNINESTSFMNESGSWIIYTREPRKVEILLKRLSPNIIKRFYEIKNIVKNNMTTFLIIPRWNINIGVDFLGQIIRKTYLSSHHPLAFISIWSKELNITKDDYRNISFLDIVPTILYYLELPISSYSDGRVLKVFIKKYNYTIIRENYRLKYKIRKKFLEQKLKGSKQ